MGLLALLGIGSIAAVAIYFRKEIAETLPLIGETGRQFQEFTSTTLSPEITPRLHPELGLGIDISADVPDWLRRLLRWKDENGDNDQDNKNRNNDDGQDDLVIPDPEGWTPWPFPIPSSFWGQV